MKSVEVRIAKMPGCKDIPLPKYMSEGASGMDLFAAVEKDLDLAPGQITLVPTGIAISMPPGYEGQVRPRSGLAANHGLTIVNAPGTIDSDYRGEVKIILANLGQKPFQVVRGMRIAQLVVQPVTRALLVEVEALDETRRGSGGFGHTGNSFEDGALEGPQGGSARAR